ncbi:hypothetical protein FE784_22960 [Paenibacillus hemerocallicola]|uniref:Bacterial Ig-like domain-containing protein n=1 Tax=Paenibacillus hemerocallicola TaxID=1172614 RepID=A0A5C4T477_9BACL|nr:hypothetical protein [Paenibacillus hemerocallicola]TNJ63892.1 hypothetical protein FE784_22960 [Paenibacillus hemerocallicola]
MYTVPLSVRLVATDEFSAVIGTVYRLGGVAEWQPYNGPIGFGNDGIYEVRYRSEDSAGNTETAKSAALRFDRTTPAISANVTSSVYADSGQIDLQITFGDAGSGTDHSRTVVTLDGQPIAKDASLQLHTLPLGQHTIAVTAEDFAVNAAGATFPVRTETSVQSVGALIDLFAANGSIDNGGIANSLRRQLANGSLQALLHHLQAQRGKHVSNVAADVLIRDVGALLQ